MLIWKKRKLSQEKTKYVACQIMQQNVKQHRK